MEVLGVETLQIFRQHPEPCNPILIYIYTHTYIYIHIYIHIFFLICLSSVFFLPWLKSNVGHQDA